MKPRWRIAGLALFAALAPIAGCSSDYTPPTPVTTVATQSKVIPSPRAVEISGGKHCDDAVRAKWLARTDGYGVPSSAEGWRITTADPAGGTPGESWRLRADYAVKVQDTRGNVRQWTQTFFCDVDYGFGDYQAKLVD